MSLVWSTSLWEQCIQPWRVSTGLCVIDPSTINSVCQSVELKWFLLCRLAWAWHQQVEADNSALSSALLRSNLPVALCRALPRPSHTAAKPVFARDLLRAITSSRVRILTTAMRMVEQPCWMLSALPGQPRTSSPSAASLFHPSQLCNWRQDPPLSKGKFSGWKTSPGWPQHQQLCQAHLSWSVV